MVAYPETRRKLQVVTALLFVLLRDRLSEFPLSLQLRSGHRTPGAAPYVQQVKTSRLPCCFRTRSYRVCQFVRGQATFCSAHSCYVYVTYSVSMALVRLHAVIHQHDRDIGNADGRRPSKCLTEGKRKGIRHLYCATSRNCSCSGAFVSQTADVQPTGSRLSPRPQTLICHQTAMRSPRLPFNGLHPRNPYMDYYSFTNPGGMEG